MIPKAQITKEKNRQIELDENVQLFIRGHYGQSEKATHRLGENIFKSCN